MTISSMVAWLTRQGSRTGHCPEGLMQRRSLESLRWKRVARTGCKDDGGVRTSGDTVTTVMNDRGQRITAKAGLEPRRQRSSAIELLLSLSFLSMSWERARRMADGDSVGP